MISTPSRIRANWSGMNGPIGAITSDSTRAARRGETIRQLEQELDGLEADLARLRSAPAHDMGAIAFLEARTSRARIRLAEMLAGG